MVRCYKCLSASKQKIRSRNEEQRKNAVNWVKRWRIGACEEAQQKISRNAMHRPRQAGERVQGAGVEEGGISDERISLTYK